MSERSNVEDDLFGVQGRRVLVTGGLSGIGAAIVDGFLSRGAHVSVLDLTEATKRDAAREFSDRGARVIGADVSDRAVVSVIRDEIEHVGGIDTLFANAGVSGGAGPAGDGRNRVPVESLDLDRWQRTLDVNLTGVIHTVQAAAPAFKSQGSGRIVVTASIAGLLGAPSIAHSYTASKAGVIGLVRELALEFAPYAVGVNGIAPGVIQTNINDGRFNDPLNVAAAIEGVPLARIGSPREILGAALLLGSEASSYITGVVLPIDGGSSAGSR